jgi:hypothetical protein
MRGPHVRFCERRGGVILRAYSTAALEAGAIAQHHQVAERRPKRGRSVPVSLRSVTNKTWDMQPDHMFG